MGIHTADTIPTVLSLSAARFGDKTAIVDEGTSLSFRELNETVASVAGAFVEEGIAPGDRIALWAPNCAGWIVACLAAQCLGAIAVPINTRLKGMEAEYILNKTRASILLTVKGFLGQPFAEQLADLSLPHLRRTLAFDHDWRDFATSASMQSVAKGDQLRSRVTSENPCDILFTSGTTGYPKGVVSGHGQTVRQFILWSDQVGLCADDHYAIVNPFSHIFGYKAGWLAAMMTGATSYPIARLHIPSLIDTIARYNISVLPGPPTLFQSFLAEIASRKNELSSLRLSVTGAASVPPALIDRMRQDLGIARVLTGYGLTEAGVVALSHPDDSAERIATFAGRPIPGIEVRCVDSSGAPVPAGTEGEICVRGYNVMQGYFEDAEATAKAIDSDGWLHTGDIGRLDEDGYVQITDRMKDMYISGGFNCYPAEIERMLCANTGVLQAAVVGVPDERLGEVGRAYVILRPDAEVSANALIEWSKTHMANYKVPREVVFVDSLPTNAAGKVQKFLLEA